MFLGEISENVDEVDVPGHRAGDDGELQPAVASEQAERRLALLVDGRRQLDHQRIVARLQHNSRCMLAGLGIIDPGA